MLNIRICLEGNSELDEGRNGTLDSQGFTIAN